MSDRQTSVAGVRDFDFLHGQWLVRNRRLRQPLSGSGTWDGFDAWCQCWPLLEGIGNADEMHTDDCGPLRASLRLYDVRRRRWNVYGVCPRHGTLQPPLTGAFRDGIGSFYGERRIDGRPVAARYTWRATPDGPRWERAWSDDGGASWEDDWIMDFSRVDWPLEIGHPDAQWHAVAASR